MDTIKSISSQQPVNADANGDELQGVASSEGAGISAGGDQERRWLPTKLEAAEVEPWPEPVNGQVLLDALKQLLLRFIVLPKWAAETLALWVLHTYAFELRDVSTYVGVESPEKRCGKTTLLTVLSELVNRPVVAANISSPAFFRIIEETRPTLLIDEADTLLWGNDELRGILNSGYSRKTAFVVRVSGEVREVRSADPPSSDFGAARVRNGDGRMAGEVRGVESSPPSPGFGAARARNGQNPPSSDSGAARRPNLRSHGGTRLARFSCWCPKVMAAIGRLPETLADRCIVIRMQRKTWLEECERLRNLETTALRQQCARLVMDHRREITSARPVIPPDLNDRAADIWEPLLALADLAGGEWPELARQAAVGLTVSAQESSPIGALLLDILILFTKAAAREQKAGAKPEGRIFSRMLVERLNGFGDRPWAEGRKGKAITDMWLAKALRPYGVRPKTMWIGETAAKGYAEVDFKEAFRRYIPRSEIEELLEESKTKAAGRAA